MVGDLKFLSMMLGKENFDTIWCYLCNLRNTQWQKKGHARGELWTLEALRTQAKKVLMQHLDGTARMGVREEPYFDIPVWRYIWPLLHMLIGLGNDILNYLVDVLDNEIQALSPKEIRTKQEVKDLESEIQDLMATKEAWSSKSEDSFNAILKQLRKDRNSLEARVADYDANPHAHCDLWGAPHVVAAYQQELAERAEMDRRQLEMTLKTIEDMHKEQKQLTSRLDACRKQLRKKKES